MSGCNRICQLVLIVMAPAAGVPAAAGDPWGAAWDDPPAAFRPLQIVHGLRPEQARPDKLVNWKRLGLGGIVCNVDFAEYMRSEARWETLVAAVEGCAALGLNVWIYDEDGYPSGGAGGLVLEKDRNYEATALVFDPGRDPPFSLRAAYEHTHASNNFYAARRYPNLIDRAAVESFIEVTHQAYRARIGKHFGRSVVAFFTDEPSLMAVNIGQLAEPVRKKVRVIDQINETIKPLPSVPWVGDLPAKYRARYREDLLALRHSLFTGQSEQDRRTRRRYWALTADLMAQRYFGSIQKWCRANGVASSGHLLHEESIISHVPLYGSLLKCSGRFDIPGLDMLSSDPQVVLQGGWLAASLPASAALLNGGRRVMTEVSDFVQTMAGKQPVSLEYMCATAAWQAAFGVTEFTLYYQPRPRSPGDYRAYGTFVGRLNALLRDAAPDPQAILYYPIYDLWAEYLPVAGPLKIEDQSARAQRIVSSFGTLGRSLVEAHVPFALADHENLAGAAVDSGGLVMAGRRFNALVLPESVELPDRAARLVDRFARAGGTVIKGGQLDRLIPVARLEPPSGGLILTRFLRGHRRIIPAVNVADAPYHGRITINPATRWEKWDPATGAVEPFDPTTGQLSLAPRQTILLVETNE